jgi:hypothetical protein
VNIAMVDSLRHHLNKDVLVSIPALFGKSEAFRCQLIGLELTGLWLKCRDWQNTLADSKREPAATFVPYAQISYLIAAPAEPPSSAAAAGESSTPRRNVSVRAPRKPNV